MTVIIVCFTLSSNIVVTHNFFPPLKDLENALNCLQREDPSLKVRVDPDSGQVILSLD